MGAGASKIKGNNEQPHVDISRERRAQTHTAAGENRSKTPPTEGSTRGATEGSTKGRRSSSHTEADRVDNSKKQSETVDDKKQESPPMPNYEQRVKDDKTKLKAEVEKEKATRQKQSTQQRIARYSCGTKYMRLDKVPSWKSDMEAEGTRDVHMEYGRLALWQGDITRLEIDAIVNAANESLLGGGGVDGAIHAAAGNWLRKECQLLDGCEPGEAKLTAAYDLPATNVIHTVGPRGFYPHLLKQAYLACMELVRRHRIKHVAFPCISTGIFGYPNAKAAELAVELVIQQLKRQDMDHVERIIFCVFLEEDKKIYKKILHRYASGISASDEDSSSCGDQRTAYKSSGTLGKERSTDQYDKKSPSHSHVPSDSNVSSPSHMASGNRLSNVHGPSDTHMQSDNHRASGGKRKASTKVKGDSERTGPEGSRASDDKHRVMREGHNKLPPINGAANPSGVTNFRGAVGE